MRDLDQLLRQHVDDRTPREVPAYDTVVQDARRGAGMPRTAPRARRTLLAAASVTAVVLGGWGAVNLLGDDGGPGGETAPTDAAPVQRSGPLPDGGAASCALEPTEENLALRSFAFDGTVAAVATVGDPEEDGGLGYATVTFDVQKWYAGGQGRQVDVQMTPPVDAAGAPGDESAEGGPTYGVGTRLLVSGEPRWGGKDPLADAVVWGCGFTVYHDPQTAAVWDRVFAP